MLILEILIVLLFILILLLLIILFIPFAYQVKAVSLDKKFVSFNAFWLFGLFGFSGDYVFSQGFESRVNILGMNIKPGKKNRVKKEKKKKKKNKKNKKKKTFSIEAIQYSLINVIKLIKHFMPNRMEGYGRLGFSDPYYTGITSSLVESLRAVCSHNLNFDYVFEEEVYEGEILLEGRIFIVYLVYIGLRLLLRKATKKLIFS